MPLLRKTVFILIILSFLACQTQANTDLNLDFEQVLGAPAFPQNWMLQESDHIKITLDTQQAYQGKYCVKLTGSPKIQKGEYATVMTRLPLINPAGQEVVISAFIKTHQITNGAATLWGKLRGDNGKRLGFINQLAKPLVGTTDWQKYSIRLPLTTEARELSFGVMLTDPGTAWFDHLEVQIGNQNLISSPPLAPDQLKWLKTQVIPMHHTTPGQGTSDLNQLHKTLQNINVVALGEPTHGSREVFQMKHRWLEFLVTQLHFSVLAMEAPMAESEEINKYVLTGQGNPRQLLKDLELWPWNTAEVLDMIEWMRTYNQKNTRKVQFKGFDFQTPVQALLNLRKWAIEVKDQVIIDQIASYGTLLPQWERLSGSKDAQTFIQKFQTQGQNLADTVLKLKPHVVNAHQLAWLHQNARLVLQYSQSLREDNEPEFRDRIMADNIRWLQRQAPQSKIALWAHNGHIQKQAKRMGHYLAQTYHQKMYVVGFFTHTGTYTAIQQNKAGQMALKQDNALLLPPANSLEGWLHQLGIPNIFLDLQSHATVKWLNQPLTFRAIGALAPPANLGPVEFVPPVPLRDYFDGLVFIDKTSSSKVYLK